MSIDHELPFSALVRYCVQQLHADLRTKAEALRDEPDVVRRAHFLAFFERARHILVRLHILCQWLGRNLPLLRAITVRITGCVYDDLLNGRGDGTVSVAHASQNQRSETARLPPTSRMFLVF